MISCNALPTSMRSGRSCYWQRVWTHAPFGFPGRPKRGSLSSISRRLCSIKRPILRAAGAQPTCVRQTIEVDLTAPWQERLITAGFDPHCPAGWLIEGFLFYLSRVLLTQLLEEVIQLAAPGSLFGL